MGASCDSGTEGIGVIPINVGQVDGVLGVVIAGNTATLSINIAASGYYWYDVFLSDSATVGRETANLPSDQIVHWTGFTDANGDATITITNTGAAKSWYAWARFQLANISSIITV